MGIGALLPDGLLVHLAYVAPLPQTPHRFSSSPLAIMYNVQLPWWVYKAPFLHTFDDNNFKALFSWITVPYLYLLTEDSHRKALHSSGNWISSPGACTVRNAVCVFGNLLGWKSQPNPQHVSQLSLTLLSTSLLANRTAESGQSFHLPAITKLWWSQSWAVFLYVPLFGAILCGSPTAAVIGRTKCYSKVLNHTALSTYGKK